MQTITLPIKPILGRIMWRLKNISDWLDENVFVDEPAPWRAHPLTGLTIAEREALVEKDVNVIRRRLEQCTRLREVNRVREQLCDMRSYYGNTAQMRAAEGSLRLEIFHKENEIIEAL
jgi:hypothetical protein